MSVLLDIGGQKVIGTNYHARVKTVHGGGNRATACFIWLDPGQFRKTSGKAEWQHVAHIVHLATNFQTAFATWFFQVGIWQGAKRKLSTGWIRYEAPTYFMEWGPSGSNAAHSHSYNITPVTKGWHLFILDAVAGSGKTIITGWIRQPGGNWIAVDAIEIQGSSAQSEVGSVLMEAELVLGEGPNTPQPDYAGLIGFYGPLTYLQQDFLYERGLEIRYVPDGACDKIAMIYFVGNLFAAFDAPSLIAAGRSDITCLEADISI